MAIETLQSNGDVLFMGKRDWLVHRKSRLDNREESGKNKTAEYRRKPSAGPVRTPAKSSEPT
jgi:hypothetical protein